MMKIDNRCNPIRGLWFALWLALSVSLASGFAGLPGVALAQTAENVHVVAPGESLSVIAERYGLPMADLMTLNNITDPDAILMGQRLALPDTIARPVVGIDPDYALEDEPATHVVRPGETVIGIAALYELTPAELMTLNGITNADHILIGQRLRLTPVLTTGAAREPDAQDVEPDHETDADAETDAETDASTDMAVPEPEEVAPEADDEASEAQDVEPEGEVTEEQDGAQVEEQAAEEQGDEQATPAPGAVASDDIDAETDTEADEKIDEEAEVEPETPADPSWTISTLNRRIQAGPGDGLRRIALRYGVDEEALGRINGLASGSALVAGQELILPATRAELQTVAPPPSEDTRTYHEVLRGESLGLIAQQYGLSLAELLTANRIADPDNVLIGQRLLIPDPPGEDEPAPAPVRLGRPQRGYFFYTVKPGDTLSELAREFDTTFLAILDYNNLPDPETVYRGVDLRIPFGPPALPVALPPSPLSGTRFVVSLSRQQCWVFQGERVLHQWVCSTGYGEWITRTGVFAVQTKLELAQSSYYELDMPYWLGIYDVGPAENGIHGLPIEWATGRQIWEGLLGQPATFGCAMLADENAARLFDLAYLGMPVYIVN